MTRAIREYAQETGMAVGFKRSGGIPHGEAVARVCVALIEGRKGTAWQKAELFRIGASGRLADIETATEIHGDGKILCGDRHAVE